MADYIGPDIDALSGEYYGPDTFSSPSGASAEEPSNPSNYTPSGARPADYEAKLREKYKDNPELLASALNAETGGSGQTYVEREGISTAEWAASKAGVDTGVLAAGIGKVSKNVGESLKTAGFYVLVGLGLYLAIQVTK